MSVLLQGVFRLVSLCNILHAVQPPGKNPISFRHLFLCFKVTGKFSIRLVPDQDPAQIAELVIAHLKKVHQDRGSPNILT